MALPVIERIALEIMNRLETLIDDGYSFTRPDREGTNISPVDKSIVLRQQPSQPNMLLSHEGNPPAMAFNVVFMCVCNVRNVFGDEAAYDSACNRAAAEIIAAIANPTISPSTWYTFDGNAVNAQIGANSPYIASDGARSGVIVPILITYRVSETDHTEART
jgi:hypothetical protein